MLVLERCLEDAIRIGEDVKVKVLRIAHTRVLLGIEAPRTTAVWREEIAPLCLESTPSPAPADNPFRVLVVEDDPAHARLMRAALTACGVTDLNLVSSGEEAVALLKEISAGRETAPDLILSDYRLPGLCGLDLLKAVKSERRTQAVPVVLISSMAHDDDVALCIASGANAFLTKPGRFDEFRETIGRIAGFWKQHRRVA